jgi:signal transduction histidine kinase
MPQDIPPEPTGSADTATPRKRRAARRRTDPLPRELGPLIEAMADGVIVTDRRGQVVLMNAALKRIIAADRFPEYFGYTAEQQNEALSPRDMAGEPLLEDRWPTTYALAGHPIPPQDVLIRGMDKLDRVLNISSTPIYDANHTIIGVVTVYRDVTAQRRLEQMKDEFLSIAGHELRAPLTPILVAAQIAERRLQQPDRADEALALVRDVIRYTQRLNALMGAVLDMTRIQGDRLLIYPEPCDAAAIIRDAIETQMTQWRRPVAIQCPDTGLRGEWDPTRLWQVITNLVSNALKYSSAESAVTVMAQVEEQDRLHIDVTDAGPGIPPEELPYLFERFYRGRQAQAGEGHREGLGLGLYITRAIVQAHGGNINANSVLGLGTTFTVELPLTPPPSVETAAE